MSHLAKIQLEFQAYLMKNNESNTLMQYIINDEKVGATKRLSIYADAYKLRIIEALATSYPKLQLLMGRTLFDKIARSYIDTYPSNYRNMRWVGAAMHVHLKNTLSDHPVTGEMARFEWSLGLAFDAEDAPTVQLENLAQIPPETWGNLSFKFHPSVQILDIHWNLISIWQALNIEETPPNPEQVNKPCLVWRSELNSHFRSLATIEYQALEKMINGANFSLLCEYLDEAVEGDATQQAARYLASWLEAGLLTEIRIT